MKFSKLMIFAVLYFFSLGATANCGPFNMFGDNDYCVSCPSGKKKVNQCPGGEVGIVILGMTYSGCGISYYDSRSCWSLSSMNAVTSPSDKTEEKKLSHEETEALYNPVKPGRATVTKSGDLMIIKMKETDFNKLMELGQTKK